MMTTMVMVMVMVMIPMTMVKVMLLMMMMTVMVMIMTMLMMMLVVMMMMQTQILAELNIPRNTIKYLSLPFAKYAAYTFVTPHGNLYLTLKVRRS